MPVFPMSGSRDFPPVARSSPEYAEKIFDRYPDLMKELLSVD